MCECSTLRRENQARLIEAALRDSIKQPALLDLNSAGREFCFINRWFSWKTNISCCEFKRAREEFVRDVLGSAEFMSRNRNAEVALWLMVANPAVRYDNEAGSHIYITVSFLFVPKNA